MIRKFNWLRREILHKGGRVAYFGITSTEEVVDRAISVLKGMIGERKDLLEPVYYAIAQYELSFYRNQVRFT